MISQKEKAITLRKQGHSYSEILKEVPVAKSTISLWLRNVGLARQQKQNITAKRIAGALRGAKARKDQRIKITKEIKNEAKQEIETISKRDLWLIGIALHWAEGAKEKENRTKVGINFSNSDPRMILLFRKWLINTFSVNDSNLVYELYIHETANIEKAQVYWSQILSIPTKNIRTYLKKNKIRTIRKNTGIDYHGLIRINVNKSTNLNRKISGWIEGICEKSL
jgi:transposase